MRRHVIKRNTVKAANNAARRAYHAWLQNPTKTTLHRLELCQRNVMKARK